MPLAKSPAAVLLGRPQGELEVVERGQQLLGELRHPAVGRHGGLARGALLVVLEVRLRALGEREVLRGLVVRRRGLRLRRPRRAPAAAARRRRPAPRRRAGPPRGSPGRRPPRSRRPRLARLVGHRCWSSTTSASTTSSSASGVAAAPSPSPFGEADLGLLLRLGALVHRLGDLVERGLEALGAGADVGRVLGGQRLADVLDRGLDLRLGGVVDVLGEVLELALGLVGRVLAGVAGLGELAQALVLVGVRLGVGHHALDLLVGQAGARLDLDLLLLAGAQVLGRHVDDAVGVDVEADLDLRDAARRGRDARELELAQRLVVGRHLALALQDVDLHARLVVLRGREDLGLAGRDGGVALDQLRHHAALGLDAEGERGDVEQQDVLDVAGQHARLDGGADGHDLVRVDAAVRLLAGELLDLVLDRGHAGHAAHEDDVVDRGDALVLGVVHGLAHRADDALDQRRAELVELGAREAQVEVLRARRRRR